MIVFVERIKTVKTLRDRLIYARTLRGLSQAELARRSGCAQSAIGNIESGERKSLRNLIEVARVLNCDPGWLYDGKGAKPMGGRAQLLADIRQATNAMNRRAAVRRWSDHDPSTREYLDYFKNLDTDYREELLDRVRFFVAGCKKLGGKGGFPIVA